MKRKKNIANSINRHKETIFLSELYGTIDISDETKTYDDKLNRFISLANELKNSEHRDCNKLGMLGELATFVYYVIYRRFDYLDSPTSADMYFIQEHYGDFFIHDYNSETVFTVDSKSSATFDFIPRLMIPLSHYDKDNNPYYGKKIKKKTNYSWVYYLDCCDKINAFNLDLFQLFIIEDLQSMRKILLSEYITKKGNAIDDNLDILNSKFKYDALCKCNPIYDNKGTDREVKTEILSLALTDEVIGYLGSKLTIVQFENKREVFSKSDINELLKPNRKY